MAAKEHRPPSHAWREPFGSMPASKPCPIAIAIEVSAAPPGRESSLPDLRCRRSPMRDPWFCIGKRAAAVSTRIEARVCRGGRDRSMRCRHAASRGANGKRERGATWPGTRGRDGLAVPRTACPRLHLKLGRRRPLAPHDARWRHRPSAPARPVQPTASRPASRGSAGTAPAGPAPEDPG